MSSDTESKLMDTVPGGESTQYESIKTITKDSTTAAGQSHDLEPSVVKGSDADNQQKRELRERGEKTAENIRYGESISEHGYGGESLGNSGEAGQEGGYGGMKDTKQDDGDSRLAMGYESGNGVGD